MRALHGETLLTAWERCYHLPEPARALTLLHVADAEQEFETLAQLPLAERNRMLLELRAMTFGRRMEGFAVCDHCNASLEFDVDVQRFQEQMLAAEPLEWTELERDYHMRPANTGDLLASMKAADEEEARAILLARTTTFHGTDAGDFPEEFSIDLPHGLIDRFDALNASAEIQLTLRCASCGGLSELDLDIAGFLDRETSRAARRLLGDIHRLATAYGWSEQSIAEMSNSRRTAYLAMLES